MKHCTHGITYMSALAFDFRYMLHPHSCQICLKVASTVRTEAAGVRSAATRTCACMWIVLNCVFDGEPVAPSRDSYDVCAISCAPRWIHDVV